MGTWRGIRSSGGTLSRVLIHALRCALCRRTAKIVTLEAGALWRLQPLWVARDCPECARHYCTAHWELGTTIPSLGDAYSMDFVTDGTCPAGHTRVVEE